jgi:hypothetical protein
MSIQVKHFNQETLRMKARTDCITGDVIRGVIGTAPERAG